MKKVKLLKPVEIEFTPEEFKQLLNIVHAACMHHEHQLSGKALCAHPQVIEERLNDAMNLYKRLVRIEKVNGTLVEEDIKNERVPRRAMPRRFD